MFRSRMAFLVCLLLTLFLVVEGRLFWMQVVRGAEYRQRAEASSTRAFDIEGVRGTILDRSGITLARSVPTFDLEVLPGDFDESRLGAVTAFLLRAGKGAGTDRPAPRNLDLALWLTRLPEDVLTRVPPVLRGEAQASMKDLQDRLDGLGGERPLSVPGRWRPLGMDEAALLLGDDKTLAVASDAARLLLSFGRPTLSEVVGDPRRALAAAFERLGDPEPLVSRERSLAATFLGLDRFPKETPSASELLSLAGGAPALLSALEEDKTRLAGVAKIVDVTLERLLELLDVSWLDADVNVTRAVMLALRERKNASSRDISKFWQRFEADHPHRPARILSSIGFDEARMIFVDAIPGISIGKKSGRIQRSSRDIPLIGWTSEVDDKILSKYEKEREELEKDRRDWGLPLETRNRLEELERDRYLRGDLIGSAGVETLLEGLLRGRAGHQVVRIDRNGRAVEIVEERNPRHGSEVKLTIESSLQDAGYSALEGRVGACVLLEVGTGRVLCLASTPTCDVASFRESYLELIADPRRPLSNRAFRPPLPIYPGSTFKVVVAIAGLSEGAVDLSTTFHCEGSLRPAEPNRFKCLGVHGDISLERAIAESCNVYFYRLGEKLGPEILTKWARNFGFGSKTGIELPDLSGRIDPLDKRPGWLPGEICHFAIGQNVIDVTPLQVARMMAVIPQNGVLVTPTLILEVDGKPSLPGERQDLGLDPRILATMKGALESVVTRGTARSTELGRFRASGKTGTAQVDNRRDQTWFVGYVPREEPRVVVAVVIEDAEAGSSTTAAPVAVKLLEAWRAWEGGA